MSENNLIRKTFIPLAAIVLLTSCNQLVAQKPLQPHKQPESGQEQHYLPSLFSELTGVKFTWDEPQKHRPISPDVLPESALSSAPQIVVETWMLTCNESSIEHLFDLVDHSRFELNQGVLSGNLLGRQSNDTPVSGTSLSATIRQVPATVGTITDEQREAIMQMVKSSTLCDISQLPTVTMFDGQTSAANLGNSRPFVVSLRVIEGSEGNAIQPVIRLIEEGTIIKLQPTIKDDGVELSARIITNQIESVDTVKVVAGKAAGAIIQVPKCNLQIVDAEATIGEEEYLLIDTGIIRKNQQRVEKTTGKIKWPVVGRRVSLEIDAVPQRVLIMLKTRLIQEKQG